MTRDAVLELHRDAIVVDGHADTISRFLDEGEDLGTETGKGHVDLPRMIRGGLDCLFLSCWVEPRYLEMKQAALRALRLIDAAKRWIAANPARMTLARTAADVRRAAAEGRVCGMLCIEGGHAIEDDLALLRVFHELGVRYLTLTWNNSLSWAESARDPGKVTGLTDFGREVVQEMNRLGMMVDVSHVSEATFRDALRTTSVPVIASHSCVRAIHDHVRNLTDDQLRALAGNGGVLGVNFSPTFLGHRAAPPSRPPLDLLVDHILHAVKVAGADHVGLGSDFDGIGTLPEGVDDCSQLPNLTRRLLERGLSEGDVRKILGENFLRVMAAAIDSRTGRS